MATKGKTGNWITDIFGATSSSLRRLRELLKVVSGLPRACIEAASPASPEEFQHWQSAVLHYNGIGHAERLPGVLSRKSLNTRFAATSNTFVSVPMEIMCWRRMRAASTF